ncbi:MAG: ACT domain-containing protein [Chloroflexota bacterium]|nr:ACT domain-containing protein [Chloroflexota bacterium]MDE2970643.1 ACT domain-containing protein [Chloroflexota bacterium]
MAKSQVGVIADITAALAEAHINILSVNTENTGETGLVILTAEDNDAALQALTTAGFRAVIDDVLVFRLRDEPGALAKVAERFKVAGVNIQSLHILDRHGDYVTFALSSDDREKAETLVGPEALV